MNFNLVALACLAILFVPLLVGLARNVDRTVAVGNALNVVFWFGMVLIIALLA